MPALRYILRNITPLNVFLVVVMAAAAFALYPSLKKRGTIEMPAPEAQGESPRDVISFDAPADLSDYTVVGELNLFHPDRKPPPPEEAVEVVQAPLPDVEFTLYGTLVTDDVTLAFVEERSSRRRARGRRKRISVLRVGDTISGYVLKIIEPDRVIMVRGEEEMAVPLYNPAAEIPRGARPAREKQRTPPARGRPRR
ncbi:MAG: hypothetical protein GTN70_01460 [Deltaproteobacteria bacterium]|nr:hypothetical protein [Deltaproteobacteria bacterium]NIS76312.1 hypothetical protein [Deltaproteobacteria bacterium]